MTAIGQFFPERASRHGDGTGGARQEQLARALNFEQLAMTAAGPFSRARANCNLSISESF